MAEHLEESPDAATTLLVRLLQLPASERRRLIQHLGAVAVSLANVANTLRTAEVASVAIALLPVIVTLYALRNALEDSLRQ
jgi:hypothetical protein